MTRNSHISSYKISRAYLLGVRHQLPISGSWRSQWGGENGAEQSLGNMHIGLGLGTHRILTSNDVFLPDSTWKWVGAEILLVGGISPTQSIQGSMVHVGFPVGIVYLTHVSVLDYSNQRRRSTASFFFCTEVTTSLMGLKFNFFFQQWFPCKAL